MDGVVHLAALHGIHLGERSPEDFWRTNVDGTIALVQAAAEAGVRWRVFASSIGVYGDATGWLDEERRGDPVDVYQLTKAAGEMIVRFGPGGTHPRGVSLRLGIFIAAPPAETAARLLAGGVLADDAAEAIVRVGQALERGCDLPPALNVVARVPFNRTDLPVLTTRPREALRAHWPWLPAGLDEAKVSVSQLTRVYPTQALRRAFGWEPRLDLSPLQGVMHDVPVTG